MVEFGVVEGLVPRAQGGWTWCGPLAFYRENGSPGWRVGGCWEVGPGAGLWVVVWGGR